METICDPVLSTSIQESSDLHEIVGQLVTSLSEKATYNKNVFVNEIPEYLQVSTDPKKITAVLSGLLSAVVSYAKDSCIRLSAKIYGNVILLQVKDSGICNSKVIESQVRKLQPLAEKMRGAVGITGQRNNVKAFTFGFPDLP